MSDESPLFRLDVGRSGGFAVTALERLVPNPGLVEIDVIDVEAEPRDAWAHVRHGNLGGSALIRALFALRTIPSRLRGEPRR